MSLLVPLQSICLIGFALLLAAAAWQDLRTMRIADWVSVAIVGAFGIWALSGLAAGDMTFTRLGLAIGCGVGVFAIGALGFAAGVLGGGDVKLLAACCLWFDWSAGWRMLVAVALVGGVEAILVTVIRALPVPPAARARAALLRRCEPLPYGIAIAAGMALFVLQAMR